MFVSHSVYYNGKPVQSIGQRAYMNIYRCAQTELLCMASFTDTPLLHTDTYRYMLQCLMSLSTHYIPPFKSRIHIWIMPDWPARPDRPLRSIWCRSDLSIMRHNCTAVGVCHERCILPLFEEKFYHRGFRLVMCLVWLEVANDGTAQSPAQHNLRRGLVTS